VEFSRGTLQQVLECLPCAAFVWDEQQRIVAHNCLAAQLVAIPPGNTSFLPPPAAPAASSSDQRQCWAAELTSPSGETLAAELAARRISVEGSSMRLVLIHELRTATRSAEVLARSEVRLRQAVHVAQLGIFEHDHVNDTVYFSPEHRAIYGWGPEVEPTLERIMAVAHPRDVNRVAAAIARAHDPTGDGVCDIEGRVLRPNGEARWTHARSQTFFGMVGGRLVPVRTVGASLDVTESKVALERQQHLVSILDATPDLVGIAELDGTLLYVNRAAREAFALGAEASVQDIIAQVGASLRQQLTEVIVPTAIREGLWRGEVVLSTPIAAEQPYSLVVLAHGGAQRSFVSVIAHDLSAVRRLEEQARQSQKMEAIGRLAGGIAHDFNNLLSVILGYLDLALAQLPQGAPIGAFLRESRLAAERAADLTRQMLAFSRKQMLKPRVIHLGEVLREMEPMVRRLVGEDIELSIGARDDSLCIRADKSQLEQVVLNLVVNARDAMPEGGLLEIDVQAVHFDSEYASGQHGVAPGRYVMMAVSDSGVGMDATTTTRIFEPFFSTKGAGRGTGLGLATVFGIVKQNGGHIWVYSEPGRGTTFELYFPQSDEGPTASAPVPSPPAPISRSATILVVEDEPQLRSMVSTVLRGEHYLVIETEDPLQAIELSRTHVGPIDILLTDVVMPHLSGRKLAERLAPTRPEMRVVYMSGYTEDTIVHQGVLDPSIHFLPKPIVPSALRNIVRQVLRGTDRVDDGAPMR
jgi:two-component system, cell cycle sensor histidine kinase and response regulator CckA